LLKQKDGNKPKKKKGKEGGEGPSTKLYRGFQSVKAQPRKKEPKRAEIESEGSLRMGSRKKVRQNQKKPKKEKEKTLYLANDKGFLKGFFHCGVTG